MGHNYEIGYMLSIIKEHIKSFWIPSTTWKQDYLDHKEVKRFMAYEEDKPFAFIQFYKVRSELFTIGIDQLIGEEDFLHQGYGQLLIQSFIDLLSEDVRIDKVIVDPQVNNQKAIACYENIGFKKVEKIENETGEVFIMELAISKKC